MTTWLVSHSLSLLRVSPGADFLFLGALKFVLGLAQGLVVRATDVLSLGPIPRGWASS